MRKKYWYLTILNAILRFIIILLFIYYFIINNYLWSFFTILMIIVSLLPVILRRYLHIDLPLLFDFFVSLALIFHIGNELLDETIYIDIYNKFTHFFSAIVVAFISLIILYVVHEYEGNIVSNTKKVLFDIIIITISLGVLWELMEWGTDMFFGLNSQVDLDDTMFDLIADTLGGIIMSIIGYLLIKREVLPRIAYNIKQQLDELIKS
jgi:uncharacterized membrane protein YjdF